MHNFGSSEITDVGNCSVSGATQLVPYTRHHYYGSPSSFSPKVIEALSACYLMSLYICDL